MNTLPWQAQLALAALAGFAAGLLLMWLLMRPKARQHRQERDTLMQEFGSYRRRVDEHFAGTAAAVDELNRSYEKVIRHLSSGAHSLMGKETLQQQLNRRGNAAVTLAYLSTEAGAQAEEPPEAAAITVDAVTGAPPPDLEEQTPISDAPVITPPPLAGGLDMPSENEPQADAAETGGGASEPETADGAAGRQPAA